MNQIEEITEEIGKREIKFRVWDGVQMFYENLQIDFNDPACVYFGKSENLKSAKLSEVMLPQFTGLKDKNGKEIYEGDIVKWLQAKGGVLPASEQPKICEVVWEDCSWVLLDRNAVNNGKYGRYSLISCHLEIIGNIFENSELLTPSK